VSQPVPLEDISIRTELRPGDMGYWIYLHGALYSQEFGFGIGFETYVAKGLCEFYDTYNPARSRVWVCEHDRRIIASLLLLDRGDVAQLRYFQITPEYRGIGLGSKLLGLYMSFLRECGYSGSYLWTVDFLPTAASLYRRFGFRLTEEKEASDFFGRLAKEQRYDIKL
jgi:GNAT superfamily N-acetyltransferase